MNHHTQEPDDKPTRCALHEESLAALTRNMQNVTSNMEAIKIALLGDQFGNKGVVHRLSACESTINEVEVKVDTVASKVDTYVNRGLGIIWAAGLAGGAIGVLATVLTIKEIL